MKLKDAGPSGSGGGRRRTAPRIRDVRMEWMDPLSWRLPSGKALAEFALQAGFLAPLMLGGPRVKKQGRLAGLSADEALAQRLREAPGSSGSFPKTGYRETE